MKLIQIFTVAILLTPIVCFGKGDEEAANKQPQAPLAVAPGEPGADVMMLNIYMDGAHFDPKVHTGIYKEWPLVQQKYLNVLRSQVLNQDVWHQAESRAHFDNCHFGGGTKYIRELMVEVDTLANRAANSRAKKDKESEENDITEAYKRIGMLLHGVQDFYAHSNYVEILVKQLKNKEITALEFPDATISLWQANADDRIDKLKKAGLVSGVVWWGFPKDCKPGALAHSVLAKDGNKGRGAEKVPDLQNQTYYDLALKFAKKASIEFIEFAWDKWPVLTLGKPKDSFPLEVFVDRRKLE